MVWLKRCGGAGAGNDLPTDDDNCSAWESELDG